MGPWRCHTAGEGGCCRRNSHGQVCEIVLWFCSKKRTRRGGTQRWATTKCGRQPYIKCHVSSIQAWHHTGELIDHIPVALLIEINEINRGELDDPTLFPGVHLGHRDEKPWNYIDNFNSCVLDNEKNVLRGCYLQCGRGIAGALKPVLTLLRVNTTQRVDRPLRVLLHSLAKRYSQDFRFVDTMILQIMQVQYMIWRQYVYVPRIFSGLVIGQIGVNVWVMRNTIFYLEKWKRRIYPTHHLAWDGTRCLTVCYGTIPLPELLSKTVDVFLFTTLCTCLIRVG